MNLKKAATAAAIATLQYLKTIAWKAFTQRRILLST
jgi:hypothetical protein